VQIICNQKVIIKNEKSELKQSFINGSTYVEAFPDDKLRIIFNGSRNYEKLDETYDLLKINKKNGNYLIDIKLNEKKPFYKKNICHLNPLILFYASKVTVFSFDNLLLKKTPGGNFCWLVNKSIFSNRIITTPKSYRCFNRLHNILLTEFIIN
jgi:hypothetical protein